MGPKHLVHAAKCNGRMDQKSFGVTHVFSDLSKVINNAWATTIYLLHRDAFRYNLVRS